MAGSFQRALPPMPLERVENEADRDLHKVENDLSIEEAKQIVGQIVAKAILVTASGLKDFGDKSQVGRWCRGQENPNLARLIQRPDVRKALALALAATCVDVEVNTEIRFKERA